MAGVMGETVGKWGSRLTHPDPAKPSWPSPRPPGPPAALWVPLGLPVPLRGPPACPAPSPLDTDPLLHSPGPATGCGDQRVGRVPRPNQAPSWGSVGKPALPRPACCLPLAPEPTLPCLVADAPAPQRGVSLARLVRAATSGPALSPG